ncbi:hypothetical protein GCM10027084_05770 [Pseudoxanthomonas sangjuensis]|uniref:hypothetical protein n=1 Tax=Pseudoxanthomonas sangjuensis TaxID=1503750 RepID=UPI0013914143|nr:hypothetical protein [Pseudoxanthomonas sangjuensis]
MEEELRRLVVECTQDGLANPLRPDRHIEFSDRYGITVERFYYCFAKIVALDFADGVMSFSDGDGAMNRLWSISDFGLTGFALEVFEAFDEGEYTHSDDPSEVIPWQKYTLPWVMEALTKDGLLARVQSIQMQRGK